MKTAKITQKQNLAACALARGETVTNAAIVAGISRVTLHIWLRDDLVFQAYLNKLKEEQIEAVVSQLQSAASTAVQTLVKVMQSSKNDVAKINAATKVLEMTGFTKETSTQYGWMVGGTTVKKIEEEKSSKMMNDALMASLAGLS